MEDRITKLMALLEADPQDAFCLYGVAMEHAKTGRHEEAIAWFDRALAADPDHCYAYFHKAKSQEEAGDNAAAADTLRAGLARARQTGDTQALREIAAYLDELGDELE